MATIKELAAYTGLSPSTVSIVLGGKAQQRKIPESTQRRVQEAAQALGYRPNISARRLRDPEAKESMVVAVFWAEDFRAPMMVRFLRGLRRAIQAQGGGCEVLIHPYTCGRLREERSLISLSMFNAAVICNASAEDLAWLEQAKPLLPIVLYNRRSDSYCTVNVDDARIGALPAEVFSAHGRRRAAVLTADEVFYGMRVRTDRFLARCGELGLAVGPVLRQENSMRGGCEGALALCALPGDERPDCLFCASDALALGALRGFHQRGLCLPQALELIAVGNGEREAEEYAWPSLAVVSVPIEEMAVECFYLLRRLVRGEVRPPFSRPMEVRYLPGESCPESP